MRKFSLAAALAMVITIVAALFPAGLVSQVNYQFTAAETQLTTNTFDQFYPHISGPWVVYTDRRELDADIYLYSLETGAEVPITPGGGDQMLPEIDGTRVVYTDFGTGNADVLLYDIGTGQTTRLTSDPADQRRPDINGHLVVWEDDRDGDLDIFLLDLNTMEETRLTSDSAIQRKPVVCGSRVAWEDYGTGTMDLHLLDLETGDVTVIGAGNAADDLEPAMAGDIIAFTSNRASVGDLYYYRISTGETVALYPVTEEYERLPRISGDFISYESYASGDANLWIYSIPLGVAVQATAEPSEQYLHDIDGQRLVCTDDRHGNLDIFMIDFDFLVPADTPGEQIADILDFFDDSVEDGSLAGSGSGHSAVHRRDALRNMLEAARDLIDWGDTAGACRQLFDAYLRTDGQALPPDFVTGPAAPVLASQIMELMQTLRCPQCR